MRQIKSILTKKAKAIWLDSLPEKNKRNLINSFYYWGFRSFLIYNDPEVVKELSKLKKVQVSAIVPDASLYVREMTKYGLKGMALRKIRSLGLFNLLRLIIPVLKNVPGILKKNFKVLLPILVRVDYLELKKLRPNYLFLHYQMTDLALANDNKELILAFLSLAKNEREARNKDNKSYQLGLMTNNLSLLEKKMEEWNLDVKFILAPFNSKGFGMRESKERCESLLSEHPAGKESQLGETRKYFSFSRITADELAAEESYLNNLNLKESFICLEEENY